MTARRCNQVTPARQAEQIDRQLTGVNTSLTLSGS